MAYKPSPKTEMPADTGVLVGRDQGLCATECMQVCVLMCEEAWLGGGL